LNVIDRQSLTEESHQALSQINQSNPTSKAAHSGASAKPDSFEKNLERLDAIVHQLEDAELPLEKALELYEEGMGLSDVCQKQLEAAEGRVDILRKRAGGKVVAEPFEEEAKTSSEEE
jgi:exodeoxyribonuclease VII small subunit